MWTRRSRRPKLPEFILYMKVYSSDCQKLLKIIQFLYHQYQIDARPTFVIEQNFPPYIRGQPLPCVHLDRSSLLIGLDQVVAWLEKELGISELIEKSNQYR